MWKDYHKDWVKGREREREREEEEEKRWWKKWSASWFFGQPKSEINEMVLWLALQKEIT